MKRYLLSLILVLAVLSVPLTACNTLTNTETLASIQTFISAVSAAVPIGLQIYEAIQAGRNDEAQAGASKYSQYLDKLESALAVAEPYLPPSIAAMARDVIKNGRLILAGLSGAKSAHAAPNVAECANTLRALQTATAGLR